MLKALRLDMQSLTNVVLNGPFGYEASEIRDRPRSSSKPNIWMASFFVEIVGNNSSKPGFGEFAALYGLGNVALIQHCVEFGMLKNTLENLILNGVYGCLFELECLALEFKHWPYLNRQDLKWI